MRATQSIAALATALALAAGAAPALAQEKNNTVRLGLYALFWHTAADDVKGPFVPPGVTADVGNVQTVYLAYIRRLSPHFDLELAAGVPPKTDTIGKGPASLGSVPWNGQVVGSVKWFSPTLLLHYKFRDESATLRPYIGAGINFTHFYDRQINAAGDAALGGPTSVNLKNSIGPAATVGLYYHIRDNFSAIASFSVSEVGSKLEAHTAGLTRKSNVEFNPHAFVIALGYSF
jgi:outer membrane protein